MKSKNGQGKDVEFEFAGFRLDYAARKLTKQDGTPVKLSSRAFDTLAVLVARPGETLTKRFMLHEIWPDVVVGDNNLNQAIAAIRRVLGDNDEPRRIVQTVPGRGFCFIADVRLIDAAHGLALTDLRARDTVVTVADYF